VQIIAGDSDAVSNSGNTAGSRSALEVGNAAATVARAARRSLVERAQSALEAGADDIVVGPSGAEVRGAPGKRVDLSALLAEPLEVEEVFQSSGAYTGAVHAVVLQLDPDTASVRVLRYAIAHDCGNPINPLLVDGQLQGGLVHGLGYALMEEAVYLPDGTLTTANFGDYTLPGRGIPVETRARLVEVRAPVLGNNPEGLKGVGETGTIPAPAAVVNALEDALRSLCVDAELGTLPLTPNRLFELLTKKRNSQP
jgi:carbon-monoxide dehydrogenase large subunit